MDHHRALIDAHIEKWIAGLTNDQLYAPIAYIMGLPAKRIRPALALIACELFGGNAKDVINEALAIELFHNFTLMHDDIMDRSPIRRGMPTVHEKWNDDVAILSGDAMLVMAYQQLGNDHRILPIFNYHALAVCEGQQKDMAFEKRTHVSLAEYKEMIRQKTAVLFSCALRIGACKAGASQVDQDHIGAFGEHLGLAFQLRDDLLDAFGEEQKVGKRIGGDLLHGKKTWLLIRGLELGVMAKNNTLGKELSKPTDQRNVQAMMRALIDLGVQREAETEVERLESIAADQLNAISVPEELKEPLRRLSAKLRARTL